MSVNVCVSPAGTNTTLPGSTGTVPEAVTSVARPAWTTYTSSSVCGSWSSTPPAGMEYVPRLSSSLFRCTIQWLGSPPSGGV
jgi:hypothetical protein